MKNYILLLFAFSVFFTGSLAVVSIDKKNSYIRVYPAHPLIGDEVRVSCRMVAPLGYTFYRTEPKVAFYNSTDNGNEDSNGIGEFGLGSVDRNRYSMSTFPDETRRDSSFVVVIKNFCLFDVGLKISCINRLHSDPNYNDEDTVLSLKLMRAAVPPPANNVCISLPTDTPLTCQSLISVTWDEVADSLTDRPVESYIVSLNVGGDNRIVSLLPSNQTFYTNMEFGGTNGTLQAEIECMNEVGNSSKVKSNTIEIYRPKIVNLTAELFNDRSMILINWAFDVTRPDWLLDICYKLSITYEFNGTETIFNTSFCLSSHTTEYVLITSLATNEHIKYVTLKREKICNQVPNILNSKSVVPFEEFPQNIPNFNETKNIFLERLDILRFQNSHLVYVATIIGLTLGLFIVIMFCCCFLCCCCYYKRKGNNRAADEEEIPVPPGGLAGPNPIRNL